MAIAGIAILWQVPGWAKTEEVAYPTSYPATTGMVIALLLSFGSIWLGCWSNRRPAFLLIGYPLLAFLAAVITVASVLLGLAVGAGLMLVAVAAVVIEISFLVDRRRYRSSAIGSVDVFLGAAGLFLWLTLGPGTFMTDMWQSGMPL